MRPNIGIPLSFQEEDSETNTALKSLYLKTRSKTDTNKLKKEFK
jgi:hypothetical protein